MQQQQQQHQHQFLVEFWWFYVNCKWARMSATFSPCACVCVIHHYLNWWYTNGEWWMSQHVNWVVWFCLFWISWWPTSYFHVLLFRCCIQMLDSCLMTIFMPTISLSIYFNHLKKWKKKLEKNERLPFAAEIGGKYETIESYKKQHVSYISR